MGNPGRIGQSGSRKRNSEPNQLGVRRSPRLQTNSAMNMSQSTDMAPFKPEKDSEIFVQGFDQWGIQFRGGSDKIAKCRRTSRQTEAEYFVLSYNRYKTSWDKCRHIKEKRRIVVSGNVHDAINEKSHGITWVGVHGVKSICAVYKRDESEIESICEFLGQKLWMHYFGVYLLSEMEDLADSSLDSKDLKGKPFAVVSLNSFGGCHKESALGENMAIDFLLNKLNTSSAIADDETIQIAIDAFQKLLQQEFKAEEIKVFVFKDNTSCDPRTSLNPPEVEKHLTAIKQRSGDNPLNPPEVENPLPANISRDI